MFGHEEVYKGQFVHENFDHHHHHPIASVVIDRPMPRRDRDKEATSISSHKYLVCVT
jgi:hypothetical protein